MRDSKTIRRTPVYELVIGEEEAMSLVEEKTIYFAETGEQNTDALLEAVKKYVEKKDLKDIVVASTTGQTGAKVAEMFRSRNVVIVGHCFGFKEPGKSELKDEYKRRILASGAKIFAGTHALSSAERAVRKDFGTIEPPRADSKRAQTNGRRNKSLR